jgi:hypothetical protein
MNLEPLQDLRRDLVAPLPEVPVKEGKDPFVIGLSEKPLPIRSGVQEAMDLRPGPEPGFRTRAEDE